VSYIATGTTTLFRNGTRVGQNPDLIMGGEFAVPADDANYRPQLDANNAAPAGDTIQVPVAVLPSMPWLKRRR
jgi:hypothetical protein